jgi:hypothetical protein
MRLSLCLLRTESDRIAAQQRTDTMGENSQPFDYPVRRLLNRDLNAGRNIYAPNPASRSMNQNAATIPIA